MLLKSHKIIGIGDIQLLEHTLEVSVKQSKYGNETPLSTPPIFAPLTCTSEFGTTTKTKVKWLKHIQQRKFLRFIVSLLILLISFLSFSGETKVVTD